MSTIWWWTCQKCWDRMASTEDKERASRDRDAHLLNAHPEWNPTESQKALQHWRVLW